MITCGRARDTVLAPPALMRVEATIAAIGDLFVHACELYLAIVALDTREHITGRTAFRICRTDLAHLFAAVFILPAIQSYPPLP